MDIGLVASESLSDTLTLNRKSTVNPVPWWLSIEVRRTNRVLLNQDTISRSRVAQTGLLLDQNFDLVSRSRDLRRRVVFDVMALKSSRATQWNVCRSGDTKVGAHERHTCLLYTSPSPRDRG